MLRAGPPVLPRRLTTDEAAPSEHHLRDITAEGFATTMGRRLPQLIE